MRVQQVLLQERKEGCWWFNKPGRCEGNTVKIVVLVICAIADLLVSAYMVLLGSEDLSARKKGYVCPEVPLRDCMQSLCCCTFDQIPSQGDSVITSMPVFCFKA